MKYVHVGLVWVAVLAWIGTYPTEAPFLLRLVWGIVSVFAVILGIGFSIEMVYLHGVLKRMKHAKCWLLHNDKAAVFATIVQLAENACELDQEGAPSTGVTPYQQSVIRCSGHMVVMHQALMAHNGLHYWAFAWRLRREAETLRSIHSIASLQPHSGIGSSYSAFNALIEDLLALSTLKAHQN